MDREAAVLRAEMSRTRAELDDKLTALHAKVSDLTPRRLTERYMPEYLFDRVVGGILERVLDPEEGFLACGTYAAGRLADPARIVREVEALCAS